jgi:hypothetical protein
MIFWDFKDCLTYFYADIKLQIPKIVSGKKVLFEFSLFQILT